MGTGTATVRPLFAHMAGWWPIESSWLNVCASQSINPQGDREFLMERAVEADRRARTVVAKCERVGKWRGEKIPHDESQPAPSHSAHFSV